MTRRMPIALSVAALIASSAARAEVEPNLLFSDGMVLQRGGVVPVWGTAEDGEEVTVTFRDRSKTTTAEGGRWEVRFEGLEAGGPETMEIRSGDRTMTIEDVLVGEVWICSGQSNMAWPVQRSADPEEVIASSADPELRLLTVPRVGSAEPQSRVDVNWAEAGPETVPDFSAVAYHFGKTLREELGVPVGLISTNVGGTPAEAWTSPEKLRSDPDLQPILDRPEPDREVHRPGWLYNAMIAPLVPYAIKGAIWYQGEANVGRAYEYRTLFPAMIASWRASWERGDFPFLFVQLAPFQAIREEPTESAWAELREAQLMTAQQVPNTAIAVITEFGEEDDIHPKQKEPVGERLALAALALAYDKDVCYSGPTLAAAEFGGGKAVLTFENTCGGLDAEGGELTGFTIAGEDRTFVDAEAEIRGDDTVVVRSDAVEEPVAVRYGWADYPVVNLENEAGLPASPFRTDDWPGVTAPGRSAD